MKEVKNELISVIVPVYKVEPYLRKCIDSIINQTYKNLEIILVDDGSPDNCGKICDEYAEKDSRIVVIHKENGGLSDARNAGIDTAKGEYLTFIDSDDWITENYIKYLYDLLNKYTADISGCNYTVVRDDGIYVKDKNSFFEDRFYQKGKNFNELFSIMLYEENVYNSSCSKLYRKTLFSNIRFPGNKIYEDTRTTPKLLHKCNKIIFGYERHYFYFMREQSITNEIFSLRNYERIEAAEEFCQFINENYSGLEKALKRRRTVAYIHVLRKLVESKNYNIKEANQLKRNALKGKDILFDKKTPKIDKIAILSLLLGVNVFKICWRVYAKITKRK